MKYGLGSAEIVNLIPLITLVVFALVLVLAEAFTKGNRSFLMGLTVAGCALTAMAAIWVGKGLSGGSVPLLGGMLVMDHLAAFSTVLFMVIVALTAMMAAGHQQEHDYQNGEFYGLVLLAAAGMVILAMAADMVSILIGIETMSLSAYVLVAMRRKSSRSPEGALKYFIMGAFATAFLLYGIALLYGATGTTNLQLMASKLAREVNGLSVFGVLFMVIAFGFKVAAVPFHMWAPDAYEGAPTPVTGFMASAIKAAAFIALIRVFDTAFGGDLVPYGRMGWATLFSFLAAISMTIANIAALKQDNIKRMLAYSSIAHAGLLLIGVVAMGVGVGAAAKSAVLYYLLAYSVTTLGAFAVVSWIGAKDHERVQIEDWSGLAKKHPAAALAMAIFMLSFAGMPPTGGFFAKFYILKAGMQGADQQLLWLVAIGAINSVVSIYYYLRLVMTMYFREPAGEFKPIRSPAMAFVMVSCALLVLELGLFPGYWLGLIGF